MLVKSFQYAIEGIKTAIKEERNFRIMCIIFMLVIAMGFFFRISLNHWALLLIVSGFVLLSELFNTTIETLVDIVSPDYNELAGKIKDISAGAVLVGSILSAVVGLLIFLPYIF